ncbi:MAG: guanylate kinase [Pseudomonadota bacterium]|nr:guanylate kinase [Pseudomonadota bacterium]
MVLNNSLIIIISSPSGVGKTTITKKLLKKINKSYLSVSCTTRKPRKNEINNVDYFFISKKKFLKYKKENKFLETAKVHNNYYGTLKSELRKQNKNNKVILLDIDWQGARNLRRKIKKNCYSFFLLPPSISSLKKRLFKRHLDNKSLALSRLSSARKDLKYWEEYDYVYVNDKLSKCVNEISKKINDLFIEHINKSKFKKIIKKL